MEHVILETRNLTKRYNGVLALSNVSLKVKEGEFLAIMGPSGSGKTTLLNLIGALDHATEGEVIVHGTPLQEIKDLDTFRNREIGFIFQFQNLIPTLTARENVEIPMHELNINKTERRKKSLQVLVLVGLERRINHKPSQLSGGERQRVAIARALVNDPAIILADEPTGELDSTTGQEIITLMKKIAREGKKTFLIVTHDYEVAKKSNQIIHLKDGKIDRKETLRNGELLEDLIQFQNSTLGKKILKKESVRNKTLEKLRIFENDKLGKYGETLRELFLELQEIVTAQAPSNS
ncbi:MAG: ABC transporter ATP-binding protein [Candidatus Hodarchaeota archaeon]